jgi:hypothetical protein
MDAKEIIRIISEFHCIQDIVTCMSVTIDGVWTEIGFTEHLHTVTIRNCNAIANSHTL